MRHKKIKIGAYQWTFKENSSKMGTSLGTCDYEKLEIKIKKGLPESVKQVTIIHELCHALFFSSGISPKDEDTIVDCIANQLLLFIQNNPDFFKEFFLKEKDNI